MASFRLSRQSVLAAQASIENRMSLLRMQSACCEEVMMTEIHELAVMRWTHAVGLVSMLALLQCNTPEESILGTFVLDEEAGCELCPERGPQTMRFDDESPGATLGSYAFDFSDGGQHAGQYELVYLESSVVLVLYPETATAAHFGLIGTAMQTEYEVGQNNIREGCNGLRNCVWRREADG